MKSKTLILLTVLLCGINIFAQEQNDYSKEPGYFDFSEITSVKSGELTTEIYLEEPLLKMVAKMGEAKEEGLGDLIEGLKFVKVNEFVVDKNKMQKLDAVLGSVDKNLQLQKWDRIIKTKQKNYNAYVFVKGNSNGGFDGLVITAYDSKGKVTLVNIIGKINLETIGKLSKQFDFPDVGKMRRKEAEKE